jgi:regulator of sigma E protease
MLIYGIVALGILVFVHELGHFLVAKYFKVGVLEFAIGFGKKIWKRRIGETTYAIGIIPLGGYVRMVGDDPQLLEPDQAQDKSNPADLIEGVDSNAELSPEEKALLADESKWFLKKSYWPKMAIVVAGPLFNLIFALLVAFALFYFYGKPDLETLADKPIIGSVNPFYPADKAGLKRMDVVKSIDGKAVSTWTQLADTIAKAGEKELVFVVERKDSTGTVLPPLELKITPTYNTEELTAFDDEPQKKRRSMIGIQRYFNREPLTFVESLVEAPQHVWFLTRMTFVGLQKMITGQLSAKNISGPLGILDLAARSAEEGFDNYFNFIIFLSVSLAVFNLLPIPILDGGHMLFFTLGALKGEPVSLRIQQRASQVGLFLLLALMLFAVSMDISRFLGG